MSAALHPLVIGFEEHFQLSSGRRRVPERHWPKFPARIGACTETCLELLDRHGARATFLVGDWAAARYPGLLARLAGAGHELACRFDPPRPGDRAAPVAMGLAKDRLEQAAGIAVNGAACPAELAVLAGEAGFAYLCDPAGAWGPWRTAGGLPMIGLGGGLGARGAGTALRLVPQPLVGRYLARWQSGQAGRPFSFQLWELDADLPELAILGPLERLAAYRNLTDFAPRLERLLSGARFGTLGALVGVGPGQPVVRRRVAAPDPVAMTSARLGDPITLVVPCFNEEAGLAYLANALAALRAGLGRRHPLSFVLVDDGSRDATWAEMNCLFGGWPEVRLVRHEANRGIGAAILTGVAAATAEIVAVMDSDCSYDPARIEEMLPLLAPDVGLVTASPYHPLGGVEGVPEWRLVLSRGASWAYRRVLSNKLATYTSCFRVCRRSALKGLALRHEGYIGVVEMLARLDLAGWRVVEHPVVLEARLLGRSKLKILRVIAGHLRFLAEIGWERLRGAARNGLIKA